MESRHVIYYLVGHVERGTGKRSPSYRWHDGYSLRPDGGAQPWRTYREAQADARAEGAVAKFVHSPITSSH